MKNRYHELQVRRDQSIKPGKAKPNCKSERDQALEMFNLLRNYTYQLIGLGNCFRRIAGDFSGHDGSNWRHNRYVSSERLKALATLLTKLDPYDVDSILSIERELESIVSELSKESSNG